MFFKYAIGPYCQNLVNFTVPENTRMDSHKTRKPFFVKTSQAKNSGKNLLKVSGKSCSAENPKESFMLVSFLVKIEGGGAPMKKLEKKRRYKKIRI